MNQSCEYVPIVCQSVINECMRGVLHCLYGIAWLDIGMGEIAMTGLDLKVLRGETMDGWIHNSLVNFPFVLQCLSVAVSSRIASRISRIKLDGLAFGGN